MKCRPEKYEMRVAFDPRQLTSIMIVGEKK